VGRVREGEEGEGGSGERKKDWEQGGRKRREGRAREGMGRREGEGGWRGEN